MYLFLDHPSTTTTAEPIGKSFLVFIKYQKLYNAYLIIRKLVRASEVK